MLANLAVGMVLVVATSIIHAGGLLALSQALRGFIPGRQPELRSVAMVGYMLLTVLGLFVLHTIEIWVWALAYLAIGGFSNLYDALFFSTLSFSTLGAESISLPTDWGLAGSIEGVAGFLLIGWSTAYLFAAWTRHGPLSWGENA